MSSSAIKTGPPTRRQVIAGPHVMAFCPFCSLPHGCGHQNWAAGQQPGPHLMSYPVGTSAASS